MFPNAVAYAVPFFVIAVVGEAFLIRKRRGSYHIRDAATSIAMGIGNQVVAIVFGTAFVLFSYDIIYQYRFFPTVEPTVLMVLLCFLLDDFCYYWFHRVSHEHRWFWASHVVHHSSRYYNLATALRQTWTGKATFTFIFSMPLMLLGFTPEMVLFVAGVNLVYQFWIHTELVDRLGPLEWIFNTPSHHRVHHATNPHYLDANYAGVFIIWDRLFGTFVAERDDDRPDYGIIKNIKTFNPFVVAFHEWHAILKDVKSSGSMKHSFNYLFARPGWSPDGSRQTTRMIKEQWQARQHRKAAETVDDTGGGED